MGTTVSTNDKDIFNVIELNDEMSINSNDLKNLYLSYGLIINDNEIDVIMEAFFHQSCKINYNEISQNKCVDVYNKIISTKIDYDVINRIFHDMKDHDGSINLISFYYYVRTIPAYKNITLDNASHLYNVSLDAVNYENFIDRRALILRDLKGIPRCNPVFTKIVLLKLLHESNKKNRRNEKCVKCIFIMSVLFFFYILSYLIYIQNE